MNVKVKMDVKKFFSYRKLWTQQIKSVLASGEDTLFCPVNSVWCTFLKRSNQFFKSCNSTQQAIMCSKLTTETQEQGVKYVQS